MAREPNEGGEGGDAQERAVRRHRGPRVPWIVAGGLIVLFVVGALIAGGSKKSTPAPSDAEGVRAVVVPTDDRSRTVVVPPCNTGQTVGSRDAASQVGTQGAAVVRLPRAQGERTVLVPRCDPKKGAGASGGINYPAAAFALEPDARLPRKPKDPTRGPSDAQVQLVVPKGSGATTIVVPGCRRATTKRTDVVEPPAGGSATSLAPRC